jgi:hypothetical protein
MTDKSGEREPRKELPCSQHHGGVTVTFYRDPNTGDILVSFRIPESAEIWSRNTHEFMAWCHRQMMEIADQAVGEASRGTR